ncbi:hypothetical protein LD125_00361 [Mesoplasma sp. JKS002658]|nr:hypothetical protein [Mesoplasma sp. JKS002664]MCL8211796.1 hypothetical protein [Mesoplasma sp. JKS002662]MCL8214099.1 hypothetical protein [Mesoplasma sp. JKS002658]MCL8214473.1 hypothetical protein [Mesoplasma sp. JKS002663]MCL8215418.1 hypothetical protein [Mesoplasma sp. JKS002659]
MNKMLKLIDKMKEDLVTRTKTKEKRISFTALFFYFFKLIIFDKAFIVLSFLFLLLTAVFLGLVISSTNKISLSNWFVLFQLVFLVILISRLAIYFLNTKIKDQTLTLIVQQRTSRSKIFLAIFASIMVVLIVLLLLGNGLLFLTNLSSWEVSRYFLIVLGVLVASAFFLTGFIFMITLVFKYHIVSIIISFLILALFICSVPQQIFNQQLDSVGLTFKNDFSSVKYSGTEINQTLSFNNNVNQKQIKFPHLSKYLNDFYVNQGYTLETYDNPNAVKDRLQFWDDLGIINQTPVDENLYQLEIANIRLVSGLKNLSAGDQVDVSLSFSNTFKSLDEIKEIYVNTKDSEKKAILKDLIDFFELYHQSWKDYKKIDDTQVYTSLWNLKYDLFGTYANEQITNNAYILKTGDVQTNKQTINKDLFTAYFLANYYSGSRNDSLYFKNDLQYKKLIADFSQVAYSELFIRTLENYFIYQTSKYVVMTTWAVVTDDSYQKYLKNYKNYNLFLNLIPPMNTSLVLTTMAGKEWDKFWFDIRNLSTISFETQNNLFFIYDRYNPIFANSTDSQVPNIRLKETYKGYYIGLEVFFLVINLGISIFVFSRKDFQ